jgi:WD40 repeat protein
MRELDVESGGPVWDLVAEFLERRERGESIDTETFVRSYPDVADRLREALAGFEWMEVKARPGHAAMDEVLPRSFGNYELLRVIGRGGMGCVYEAFHRPLKRHVALKALPPHLTHVREFRLRFLREARVVASLHHTHIAPVFEVGQIGNTLYLAMPFIDGPNLRELTVPQPDDHPVITKALKARLPTPFSAAYFRWVADIGVQAADALAHAHTHGVIHRDVKPSNLLIDEHGQIWIVDFGLAKAPMHPTVTQPGELIGTLRYASPEQVRGDEFDRRSDIYSLGVTLYEVLTRRAAFPPGPSSQVLAVEPIRPSRINPRVPRDLETIVLRSMAKRPADRYASADALADDLRRFLRDEPIRARPIGWIGRLVRWSRRNPAVTGVAAVAAFLLAVFAAFHWFREVEHRVTRTKEERISTERKVSYLMASAANMIDSGRPGRTSLALDLIREAAQPTFRDELWELAIRAIDQLDLTAAIDLGEATRPISTLAVSPDGMVIAGVEPSGRVAFWDVAGGEPWFSRGFGEPVVAIEWSPDGDLILASSQKHVWLGRVDRKARVVDDIRAIAYGAAIATFGPDGKRIAILGRKLSLWDVSQGQFVWERALPDNPAVPVDLPTYRLVTWSPDGQLLAAVPADEATVELWSMPDGERLPPIGVVVEEINDRKGTALGYVTFTPESSRIACGCADGSIRIYDCRSGAWEQTLRGHETPVRWLRFLSPLGPARVGAKVHETRLVSCDDQDARFWDVARHQQLSVLARRFDGHRSASIDPRGRVLALADGSLALRAWHVPDLHWVVGPEPQRISGVATSPNGRQIAWGDSSGRVVISDADQRYVRLEIETDLRDVQLVFGPGGNILALAGQGDSPIRLYSPETGVTRELATGQAAVRSIAFVSGGQRLAAIHADGRLIVWNIDDGSPFATVASSSLLSIAASRDGKWLAGGGSKGDVRLWNTASMSFVSAPAHHASEVLALTFSPDGQSLVSASRDGLICRWQVPSLERELWFEGPGGPVSSLAYCLDGTTLATCGGDGRVFLWAAGRAVRIAALEGRSTGRFDKLCATADGRTLIAAGGPKQANVSAPGGLELWDLAAIHRAVLAANLPDWTVTGSQSGLDR